MNDKIFQNEKYFKKVDPMKKVKLYTDGACSGNPGSGGWGAVLVYGSAEKEICGAEKSTTNNRMELTAVIRGLCALKEPCEVEVVTDSKYVCDAINKGWMYSWKKNGWKKRIKNLRSTLIFGNSLYRSLHSIKPPLHGLRGTTATRITKDAINLRLSNTKNCKTNFKNESAKICGR